MTEIIIPPESPLYHAFANLVQAADRVFFAGLPGVGKSLLLQQLALMAQQQGRQVHLLQWDVTRSAFETPDMLAKYPEIDGVTHAAIRKAVGLWARAAVLQWSKGYPQPEHILIGEVPLIGSRLMELARPRDDAAEAILTDARTRFVLPVPSGRVRRMIEAARETTIAAPQHAAEARDAPPHVLRALWQDLYGLAHQLGFAADPAPAPAYDPALYRAVYEHLLRHRHVLSLAINEVLKPPGSAYDLEGIAGDLAASPDEARRIMRELEAQYSTAEIESAVARWYVV